MLFLILLTSVSNLLFDFFQNGEYLQIFIFNFNLFCTDFELS